MSSVDDVPVELPPTKSEQMMWVQNLASYIVQFAWMAPDQKQIDLVASAAANPVSDDEKDYYLYCVCGEGNTLFWKNKNKQKKHLELIL